MWVFVFVFAGRQDRVEVYARRKGEDSGEVSSGASSGWDEHGAESFPALCGRVGLLAV